MAGKARSNGEGSVFRDGDGWRVQVLIGHDPVSGKPLYRKRRVNGTITDAKNALQRMRDERARGKIAPASGKQLGAFLDSWLETKIRGHRQPATYRQYEWLIRDHIKPVLGKKALDKITRLDVQQLIKAKKNQAVSSRGAERETTRTLSVQTLRLIRAVLHAAYRDALRDGMVVTNPVDFVELPKAQKAKPAFLTPEQAKKLMQASEGSELGELILFLLVTGTRIGEATGLRWQDVDFGRAQVRICGQLLREGGALVRRDTTKTHQDRWLPLHDSALSALTALRDKYQALGFADPDGIVFLNSEGRRVDRKYASDRLKAVCRTAGIPEVSPHKLRHSAASLFAAGTGDIHAVQKMLGHSQVSLTADLYAHATAESLRSVANTMNRLFLHEGGSEE